LRLRSIGVAGAVTASKTLKEIRPVNFNGFIDWDFFGCATGLFRPVFIFSSAHAIRCQFRFMEY